MICSLALIALAFVWLMYETKFLTIRLLYGAPLVSQMIGAMIGICLLPLIEKIVNEIEVAQKLTKEGSSGRRTR